MSEPIKVGDLVVVVNPSKCCGDMRGVGQITRVTRLWTTTTRCEACGNRTLPLLYADHEGGWLASVYRLKRIPPIGELEGERSQEDIREPA